MPRREALMAKSASISHFGLFAAIQGGMAGEAAQGMIAFVFAMPFLVHPLVFFMFGRAMERRRDAAAAVYALALSAGAARASHRREFATSSGFRNSRGASPGACTPAGADRPRPDGTVSLARSLAG
jgi:hypothetical protein